MAVGLADERSKWVRPEDHATSLHPAGSLGRVSIAVGGGQRRWREQTWAIEDLPWTARQLAGREDVYMGVNRFWGRRRIAHLAALDCMYAELDYYKLPQWEGANPYTVLEGALLALEDAHQPAPSVAIASGRGLYLLWPHSPVPRAALPRYNACQKALWQTLRPYGADAAARDAARVLRLVGTRNSRSGLLVEALTPYRGPWDFDTLADEILPLTRAELSDLRVQRALRRSQSASEASVAPPKGFTQATLWEARLSDLQRLLDLRWFGHLPPGHRDIWLFLATVAMSWIAIPTVLMREAYALAHQVGGWSQSETDSRLSAVVHRAFWAARGGKIVYQGKEVDVRYRFKNETIIEWLEITEDEQRQLSTIWSDDIRREKEREAKESERRTAGVKPRDEYLAEVSAADKRNQARKLRAEGLSLVKIGERLGVSKERVRQYLSENPAKPRGTRRRG